MYFKYRNSGRPSKAICKKAGNLFNCTTLISVHRLQSIPMCWVSGARTCQGMTGMTPWKLITILWKREKRPSPWFFKNMISFFKDFGDFFMGDFGVSMLRFLEIFGRFSETISGSNPTGMTTFSDQRPLIRIDRIIDDHHRTEIHGTPEVMTT